jgi:hypothetical protein
VAKGKKRKAGEVKSEQECTLSRVDIPYLPKRLNKMKNKQMRMVATKSIQPIMDIRNAEMHLRDRRLRADRRWELSSREIQSQLKLNITDADIYLEV